MRLSLALVAAAVLSACQPDPLAAGQLIVDCPLRDTAEGDDGSIVVAEPLPSAVVQAMACVDVGVDCVPASVWLDDRGLWIASCDGDPERSVLMVAWSEVTPRA